MHAHRVVARLLKARAIGLEERGLSDQLACTLIWGLAVLPLSFGFAAWNREAAAWTALAVIAVVYTGFYLSFVAHERRAQ